MGFKIPVRRGEAHPLSKLTNQQQGQCRAAFRAGSSISTLARSYQVNRTAIRRIVHQPEDWLSPSPHRR